MVDYTGRKVTIVGGGKVGARKARYFADEAKVTVFSRSFITDFQTIPVNQIEIEVSHEDSDITTLIMGASLVIAATSDPILNSLILTCCRGQGILCNNVTEPPGDVILPAKFTGKQFTIAVSTQGGSPAVARFIREHIQATWPDLDQMIILEDHLRSELKYQGVPEGRRREILTAVLHDQEIWQKLKTGLREADALVTQRYLP